MELVGGRAIHPVNVRVGGFYRAPARTEMAALAEKLRVALDLALDTVPGRPGSSSPTSITTTRCWPSSRRGSTP